MSRLYILLFTLLLSAFSVSFVPIPTVCQAVIRVPADYPSIQQAVDAAGEGDVIVVAAGSYYEHIQVNKSLALIGEDSSRIIIDGNGSGCIIEVNANNTIIDGFTLRNATWGINLNASDSKVANCRMTSCDEVGVFVYLSGNIIQNNEFSYNGGGYPSIMHGGGIQIYSNSNIVTNNCFFKNMLFGLSVTGENNSLDENVFIDANYSAITLVLSRYNNFTMNTLRNSSHGVLFFNDSNYTRDNIFYHNNFVNSDPSDDGTSPSLNSWNNSLGEGNYWNWYGGEDLDGDLIGDTLTPFIDLDRYPLMIPYGLTAHALSVPWEERSFQVTVETDSAVAGFNFSQPQKQISFNTTVPRYAEGFCNVTIPKELLRGNPWLAKTDGELAAIRDSTEQNETHMSICLALGKGNHTVQLIGTEVIPEYPTFSALVPILVLASAALVLLKKAKKASPQRRFMLS